MPEIKIPMGNLEGEIRRIYTLKDGKHYREGPGSFGNLITDAGLNGLFTSQYGLPFNTAGAARLVVATGNTPPAYSDTSLDGVLGASTSVVSTMGNYGAPTYARWYRSVHTFTLGAIVGNVASLGFSTSATNTPLLSKALVRDTEGLPVAFPVTAEEQLVVEYEFQSIPVLEDITGSFTLTLKEGGEEVGTQTIDYTARCVRVSGSPTSSGIDRTSGLGGAGGVFIAAGTTPTGSVGLLETQGLLPQLTTSHGTITTPIAPTTVNALPYVPNSFQRVFRPFWAIGKCNYAGGVGSALFACVAQTGSPIERYWNISFNPPIPKTSAKTLQFLDFVFTQGRA